MTESYEVYKALQDQATGEAGRDHDERASSSTRAA